MKDFDSPSLFFRVDLLTGCSNLVSFSRALENNFENSALDPVSLIVVDLYQLREINRIKGFEFGDSLLRWMGIAIKDETGATVYRISGDNFVAVLIGDSHKAHRDTACELFDRAEGGRGSRPGRRARGGASHRGGSPRRRRRQGVVWKNLN